MLDLLGILDFIIGFLVCIAGFIIFTLQKLEITDEFRNGGTVNLVIEFIQEFIRIIKSLLLGVNAGKAEFGD